MTLPFEVAWRKLPLGSRFGFFCRQVAFVKFIGTRAAYDRIDTWPYRNSEGSIRWKSGQSELTKITGLRSPRSTPTGGHRRAPTRSRAPEILPRRRVLKAETIHKIRWTSCGSVLAISQNKGSNH